MCLYIFTFIVRLSHYLKLTAMFPNGKATGSLLSAPVWAPTLKAWRLHSIPAPQPLVLSRKREPPRVCLRRRRVASPPAPSRSRLVAESPARRRVAGSSPSRWLVAKSPARRRVAGSSRRRHAVPSPARRRVAGSSPSRRLVAESPVRRRVAAVKPCVGVCPSQSVSVPVYVRVCEREGGVGLTAAYNLRVMHQISHAC